VRKVPAELPSAFPPTLALFAISAIGASLLLVGAWWLAAVVVVGGLVWFNVRSSRQVRRLRRRERELLAAGIQPDYSASEARSYRRLALTGTAVLMLLVVALGSWAVLLALK
jgi:hypothetical protein